MFITRKKLELLQEESYTLGHAVAVKLGIDMIEEAYSEGYNKGKADGYTEGKADGVATAKKAFSKTIEKLATQKLQSVAQQSIAQQGIAQENKHDLLRQH